MDSFHTLVTNARGCTLCQKFLPLGPRPVFSINPKSKILIIGQAPGTKVHATGIPWNDASGNELRRWLDVDRDQFYDPSIFGIMPMGFCYPGRGKGGDLPPRPECAPTWHQEMMDHMPEVKLTLLIGQYALKYYLGITRRKTLTETVRNYEDYLPKFLPLVHPSPRNLMWRRRNSWFEEEIVPVLRERVHELIR
ncbi:uracil-DNA glycosylase [Algoriphagus ratkowskyi]|uniref:Uracil-DNA glycosylase n=1 Tax=Algoriphagus ratkowskyi TaxID=57028 RepID=A0A2W7SEA3_9BACT|nr:uracil-DNA glycosylase family protein [Algoriphagus ratkowskyi]PZX61175.1 uracil-DNA glycosylase [Algoriphagus ratkowskyi]TXD79299.1 uracil-DNA glycosylase family protein [Algoriphagus ratkowskyi]